MIGLNWKRKHGLMALISLAFFANVLFIIYVISNAWSGRTPKIYSTLMNDSSWDTKGLANLPNQTNRNITKIVIFTHMRSGSTFVSQLFSQHPDVFYMYEPLRACCNGICNTKDQGIMQNTYINDILDCDFDNNDFLSRLKDCRKFTWRKTFPGVDDFENIPRQCVRKNIIAIKIIRAESLELVAGVLGSDVALLFLIRDPRGVLNSRKNLPGLKLKYTNMTYTAEDMNVLCKEDLADYEFLQRVSRKSASELHNMPLIKLLQYESIAYDPLSNAKKLYELMNISFHDRVADWIMNNTMSESKPDLFGTKRNSKKIPNKWKTGLTNEEIRLVHSIKDCNKVIELFGYGTTKE